MTFQRGYSSCDVSKYLSLISGPRREQGNRSSGLSWEKEILLAADCGEKELKVDS